MMECPSSHSNVLLLGIWELIGQPKNVSSRVILSPPDDPLLLLKLTIAVASAEQHFADLGMQSLDRLGLARC